jgi:type VI secretion system protein ImpL
MKLLLALLKDRRLVGAIGLLALLAFIWFGGGLLKLGLTVRLALFAVVFVIAAIVYIVGRILAARRAVKLESALWAQADAQAADARPERKEEIQAVKGQLKEAVTALKASKLGRGIGGKSALYALPWYMIIGPPASGKSTALRHSGLNFPFAQGSERGVQGVGGTRNCDWWFTDQAVLLDTAGRYTTSEEDRDEWLAFLDLLKRNRARKPINGVMIGVSVADLLEGGEHQVEDHAKRIRERIDELIGRLAVQFPVYVLFTKCDLIQGFVETFGDMGREERGQVWGVTLPFGGPPPTTEELDGHFAALQSRLARRRLVRLGEVRGARDQLLCFTFPEQVASALPILRQFLTALFAPNPYQENPLFRGFYFTSGTQEGTPIDRLIESMGRSFNLGGIAAVVEHEREKKSYFLRGLFTDIIFPDRDLAGPSRRAGRRQSWLQVTSVTLALLLLVGGATGITFSWIANRSLVSGVGKAVRAEAQAAPGSAEDWQALDQVRGLALKLDQYHREGPPLQLRGGLYTGDAVEADLRDLYLRRLREVYLEPAAAHLARDIESTLSASEGGEAAYPLLKGYLMLGDPERADAGLLRTVLEPRWGIDQPLPTQKVDRAELQAIAGRHLDAYLAQVGQEDLPTIKVDERVVADARRALTRIPPAERLYAGLRDQLGREIPPLTLDTITRWKREALLTDSVQVPGMFTQQAYGERVIPRIDELARSSVEDAWILTPGGGKALGEDEANELQETMERLYARDYQKAWTAFLGGLSIVPFRDSEDAIRKLDLLAGPDSPLPILFQTVADNTDYSPEKGIKVGRSTIARVTGVVSRKLGLGNEGRDIAREAAAKELSQQKTQTGPMASLTETFAPVRKILEKGEKADQYSLDQYRTHLISLRDRLASLREAESRDEATAAFALGALTNASGNEIRDVLSFSGRVADRFGAGLRTAVHPFFERVVRNSYQGVLAETQASLDRGWSASVVRLYRERLQGRYPFDPRGREEVPIGELIDYFQPNQGAFWKFYDARLKPFLNDTRGRLRPRVWLDGGIAVSDEALQAIDVARKVTDSFFPRNAQDPRVEFQVRIHPTPGLEEIDLEIDDHRERYRMTPEEWVPLSWPGAYGSGKAAIEAVPIGRGQRRSLRFDGAWALFRLLDRATITSRSRTAFEARWNIGEEGTQPTPVSIDVKASAYANPFRGTRPADFRPPGRLAP